MSLPSPLRKALPVLAALTLSLPVLADSTRAKPGKGHLAVIDLAAPPSMMALAGQVTRTVLESAQAQGQTVVPPDVVRTRLGEKAYSELQACGGQPSCVALRMSSIGVERVVLGSFARDEKNYLVRLWLVDLGKNAVVANVDRAILIASRRLTQDVNEAVPGLLRGEREALGTLKLTTTVRGAKVTLDGEPGGVTPLTLQLKPGKHELKLEKKNYLSVTRLVDVDPNHVTDEQVRLILEPGAAPEPEAPVSPIGSTQGATPQRGGGLSLPPLAWAAGGLALAAAGAGTYFGLTASAKDAALRAGYDPATDIYAGTRSEAIAARQSATLANVAFGIAGAAAVATVLFVVLDPHPSPSLELAPVAGPSGAGVSLGGQF